MIAVISALGLFVAPGIALLALLAHRERERLSIAEAVFVAIAGSVMASAWLALALAEAGVFSLLTAASIIFGASALALGIGWRRARSPFAYRRDGLTLAAGIGVLALAFTLQARPSEYILGGRDPGTYIAAMALIARHGDIVYTDPAVLSIPREDVTLFYRHPDNPDFSWGRFMGFPLERPETGRVFPEFFHLFPAFGAYLFQSMGVKGALAAPCVFGILGAMACFFALRRVIGPGPGLLAAILLCLNVIQVWFSRFPVSEPMSLFLFFTGLFAIALWEESASPFFGALAGIAFGLSLLVRIDSVLILIPLGVYIAIRRSQGTLPWKRALAVLAPFLLLATHAVIHALVWSRKYTMGVFARPYWRQPGWVWIVTILISVIALLSIHRLGHWLRTQRQRYDHELRRIAVVALAGLALYAYLARPLLSAWAGADGNETAETRSRGDGTAVREQPNAEAPVLFVIDKRSPIRALAKARDGYCLVLRPDGKSWGYVKTSEVESCPDGLPPAWLVRTLLRARFQHLAGHDAQALRRFGWFVTPFGLVLALMGFSSVLHGRERQSLFLVLSALSFSFFYFYKMRVWNDYFFAARRFVPVILPCSFAFMAIALFKIGSRRGMWRVAAALLTLCLALVFVRETRLVAKHVDWRGSVRFVENLSRLFGPDDIVVFEQRSSIHLLSLPLWSIHGIHVLELARWNPDPDRLAHLISHWRQTYRNVYFAYTYRAEQGLCGVFLQKVLDEFFPTLEWERSYLRPPRRAEGRSFRFSVARVVSPEQLAVPALMEVDIGGSDDFQVSGFFEKEGGGEHTYRWTGSCGAVYLPAVNGGDTLILTASVGYRPASNPAHVEMNLSGKTLGHRLIGADWTSYEILLPKSLPDGPRLLRLRVPTWRPADVLADSSDIRDLGIMVDRVKIKRGQPLKKD